MNKFNLKTNLKPEGDQPKAIAELVEGLKKGHLHQTLLGVTGSGKTFTIANVIEAAQKPALVIAHNKTLAAQLCNEFRTLFPDNAVHYFVSYYDYYQPEAYMPTTDTYIGKEALINDEIDRLRHAATSALITRKDVIIVASVSCIYNLGTPENYAKNILRIRVGDKIDRKSFARKLVLLQFGRTSLDLARSTFRIRGDQWEIMPPAEDIVYTLEVKEGVVSRIYIVDPAKGFVPGGTPETDEIIISPAKHFVTEKEARNEGVRSIKKELSERLKYLEKRGNLLEAERLERRTKNDLAMIREVGYCHGIENYSRHFDGRAPGEPPSTLLDYFPSRQDGGFLTIIDESHVTVPQIRGMYEGDSSRKRVLIEYGFRLPSAIDNRPLKFEEFAKKVQQVIYTSATPAPYELSLSDRVVEQIVRPTGLVDPKLSILPAKGQVDDLVGRIRERVARKERVLVTSLTKRMAEDLSGYLEELGIKAKYLHSDVKALERIQILTDLRKGEFDVLVGVNLLREGLDLPEVSLVGILDADKEGFLRSETSLIQTIGRAARNVRGEVMLYADVRTGSIERAVRETERRRRLQTAHNKAHNITPKSIVKEISSILSANQILELEAKAVPKTKSARERFIKEKEAAMRKAASELDFELAAILRDEVKALKKNKL